MCRKFRQIAGMRPGRSLNGRMSRKIGMAIHPSGDKKIYDKAEVRI